MFRGNKAIEQALYALDEQLQAEGIDRLEIVVCGAAALFNLLWHIEDRTTGDVDILAFIVQRKDNTPLLKASTPLSKKIVRAAKRVEQDFGLRENWFNNGPAFLLDQGLPEGLLDRVRTENFGEVLIVHFVSRIDLIYLKFYAYVEGSGRPDVHYDDLFELKPTPEEIEEAARWCMEIYPEANYKERIINGLRSLSFNEIAERL